MLAAGGSVDSFWAMYAQHNTQAVQKLLEGYRIGNLVRCQHQPGGWTLCCHAMRSCAVRTVVWGLLGTETPWTWSHDRRAAAPGGRAERPAGR